MTSFMTTCNPLMVYDGSAHTTSLTIYFAHVHILDLRRTRLSSCS